VLKGIDEFLAQIDEDKLSKRAKLVFEHIKMNGQITTEEIREMGYEHPPRAARDLREAGIPIKTIRVTSPSSGKRIGAYTFDTSLGIDGKKDGRRALSKRFRKKVIDHYHSRCAICGVQYEDRYLQIDHRTPYEIQGDSNQPLESEFMPLCASCNRRKSWSCEHCENWLNIKKPELCQKCYWSSPQNYEHIALKPIRQVVITWLDEEVELYKKLEKMSELKKLPLPDLIKGLLARAVNRT